MRCVKTNIFAIALLACLAACGQRPPEPTCQETVKVFERNGQRVIQAVNGLYLRADFPIASCESRPFSKDPHARHFVDGGSLNFWWWDGTLYDATELVAARRAGISIPPEAPLIQGGIGFNDSPTPPAWWYEPAIKHQRYPIDLLPNFGLDQPDPQAGIGPVGSAYWAVRGTKHPKTGQPFVNNYCSMKPPPGWDRMDHAFEHDVMYLVQAETYARRVGNTCRGAVHADNGRPLGARVDVPGAALADIDKIYRAISKRLSIYTVE
jgi:hypothetical protein